MIYVNPKILTANKRLKLVPEGQIVSIDPYQSFKIVNTTISINKFKGQTEFSIFSTPDKIYHLRFSFKGERVNNFKPDMMSFYMVDVETVGYVGSQTEDQMASRYDDMLFGRVKVNADGNISVEEIENKGDVSVEGNFGVEGTKTEISTRDLKVTDNIIELNLGDPGTMSGSDPAGASNRYTGISINRGNLPPYLIQFDENDDFLKSGEEYRLQSIAHREENPKENSLPVWDSLQKKYVTTEQLIWNNDTLSVVLGNIQVNTKDVALIQNRGELVDGSVVFWENDKLIQSSNIKWKNDTLLILKGRVDNVRIAPMIDVPTKGSILFWDGDKTLIQEREANTYIFYDDSKVLHIGGNLKLNQRQVSVKSDGVADGVMPYWKNIADDANKGHYEESNVTWKEVAKTLEIVGDTRIKLNDLAPMSRVAVRDNDLTQGGIAFYNSTNQRYTDNPNTFNWDESGKRLGINQKTPQDDVHVGNADTASHYISIENNQKRWRIGLLGKDLLIKYVVDPLDLSKDEAGFQLIPSDLDANKPGLAKVGGKQIARVADTLYRGGIPYWDDDGDKQFYQNTMLFAWDDSTDSLNVTGHQINKSDWNIGYNKDKSEDLKISFYPNQSSGQVHASIKSMTTGDLEIENQKGSTYIMGSEIVLGQTGRVPQLTVNGDGIQTNKLVVEEYFQIKKDTHTFQVVRVDTGTRFENLDPAHHIKLNNATDVNKILGIFNDNKIWELETGDSGDLLIKRNVVGSKVRVKGEIVVTRPDDMTTFCIPFWKQDLGSNGQYSQSDNLTWKDNTLIAGNAKIIAGVNNDQVATRQDKLQVGGIPFAQVNSTLVDEKVVGTVKYLESPDFVWNVSKTQLEAKNIKLVDRSSGVVERQVAAMKDTFEKGTVPFWDFDNKILIENPSFKWNNIDEKLEIQKHLYVKEKSTLETDVYVGKKYELENLSKVEESKGPILEITKANLGIDSFKDKEFYVDIQSDSLTKEFKLVEIESKEITESSVGHVEIGGIKFNVAGDTGYDSNGYVVEVKNIEPSRQSYLDFGLNIKFEVSEDYIVGQLGDNIAVNVVRHPENVGKKAWMNIGKFKFEADKYGDEGNAFGVRLRDEIIEKKAKIKIGTGSGWELESKLDGDLGNITKVTLKDSDNDAPSVHIRDTNTLVLDFGKDPNTFDKSNFTDNALFKLLGDPSAILARTDLTETYHRTSGGDNSIGEAEAFVEIGSAKFTADAKGADGNDLYVIVKDETATTANKAVKQTGHDLELSFGTGADQNIFKVSELQSLTHFNVAVVPISEIINTIVDDTGSIFGGIRISTKSGTGVVDVKKGTTKSIVQDSISALTISLAGGEYSYTDLSAACAETDYTVTALPLSSTGLAGIYPANGDIGTWRFTGDPKNRIDVKHTVDAVQKASEVYLLVIELDTGKDLSFSELSELKDFNNNSIIGAIPKDTPLQDAEIGTGQIIGGLKFTAPQSTDKLIIVNGDTNSAVETVIEASTDPKRTLTVNLEGGEYSYTDLTAACLVNDYTVTALPLPSTGLAGTHLASGDIGKWRFSGDVKNRIDVKHTTNATQAMTELNLLVVELDSGQDLFSSDLSDLSIFNIEIVGAIPKDTTPQDAEIGTGQIIGDLKFTAPQLTDKLIIVNGDTNSAVETVIAAVNDSTRTLTVNLESGEYSYADLAAVCSANDYTVTALPLPSTGLAGSQFVGADLTLDKWTIASAAGNRVDVKHTADATQAMNELNSLVIEMDSDLFSSEMTGLTAFTIEVIRDIPTNTIPQNATDISGGQIIGNLKFTSATKTLEIVTKARGNTLGLKDGDDTVIFLSLTGDPGIFNLGPGEIDGLTIEGFMSPVSQAERTFDDVAGLVFGSVKIIPTSANDKIEIKQPGTKKVTESKILDIETGNDPIPYGTFTPTSFTITPLPITDALAEMVIGTGVESGGMKITSLETDDRIVINTDGTKGAVQTVENINTPKRDVLTITLDGATDLAYAELSLNEFSVDGIIPAATVQAERTFDDIAGLVFGSVKIIPTATTDKIEIKQPGTKKVAESKILEIETGTNPIAFGDFTPASFTITPLPVTDALAEMVIGLGIESGGMKITSLETDDRIVINTDGTKGAVQTVENINTPKRDVLTITLDGATDLAYAELSLNEFSVDGIIPANTRQTEMAFGDGFGLNIGGINIGQAGDETDRIEIKSGTKNISELKVLIIETGNDPIPYGFISPSFTITPFPLTSVLAEKPIGTGIESEGIKITSPETDDKITIEAGGIKGAVQTISDYRLLIDLGAVDGTYSLTDLQVDYTNAFVEEKDRAFVFAERGITVPTNSYLNIDVPVNVETFADMGYEFTKKTSDPDDYRVLISLLTQSSIKAYGGNYVEFVFRNNNPIPVSYVDPTNAELLADPNVSNYIESEDMPFIVSGTEIVKEAATSNTTDDEAGKYVLGHANVYIQGTAGTKSSVVVNGITFESKFAGKDQDGLKIEIFESENGVVGVTENAGILSIDLGTVGEITHGELTIATSEFTLKTFGSTDAKLTKADINKKQLVVVSEDLGITAIPEGSVIYTKPYNIDIYVGEANITALTDNNFGVNFNAVVNGDKQRINLTVLGTGDALRKPDNLDPPYKMLGVDSDKIGVTENDTRWVKEIVTDQEGKEVRSLEIDMGIAGLETIQHVDGDSSKARIISPEMTLEDLKQLYKDDGGIVFEIDGDSGTKLSVSFVDEIQPLFTGGGFNGISYQSVEEEEKKLLIYLSGGSINKTSLDGKWSGITNFVIVGSGELTQDHLGIYHTLGGLTVSSPTTVDFPVGISEVTCAAGSHRFGYKVKTDNVSKLALYPVFSNDIRAFTIQKLRLLEKGYFEVGNKLIVGVDGNVGVVCRTPQTTMQLGEGGNDNLFITIDGKEKWIFGVNKIEGNFLLMRDEKKRIELDKHNIALRVFGDAATGTPGKLMMYDYDDLAAGLILDIDKVSGKLNGKNILSRPDKLANGSIAFWDDSLSNAGQYQGSDKFVWDNDNLDPKLIVSKLQTKGGIDCVGESLITDMFIKFNSNWNIGAYGTEQDFVIRKDTDTRFKLADIKSGEAVVGTSVQFGAVQYNNYRKELLLTGSFKPIVQGSNLSKSNFCIRITIGDFFGNVYVIGGSNAKVWNPTIFVGNYKTPVKSSDGNPLGVEKNIIQYEFGFDDATDSGTDFKLQFVKGVSEEILVSLDSGSVNAVIEVTEMVF